MRSAVTHLSYDTATGKIRAAGSAVQERVGDYTLERVLGEGSAAVVYLATRDSDGLQVALKVFRSRVTADPGFRSHENDALPWRVTVRDPDGIQGDDGAEGCRRGHQ